MARFAAVLSAVRKAAARNAKAVRTVSSNNMFYAGTTLLFMTDAPAMVFFLTMMALVLFLPSSSDPMALVPPDRFKLWPLSARERFWLRIISPWLNPLTWLVLAGLVWKRITFGLWAIVAGAFAAGFFGSWNWHPRLKWVPAPAGRWRQLVRKDLRQILTALDFYCAALIAAGALLFRIKGTLPEDSYTPLTLVVLIMISTCAQTLFGLDGAGGAVRYRLLPLPVWQALAAKGAAFVAVALVLTAPLSLAGGFAGAFAALTAGNHISLTLDHPQTRWRFRSSGSYGASLAVMLPMILAAATASRWALPAATAAAACYAASLWWCGRNESR